MRHRPCLLLVGASLELLVGDALFSLLGGALALHLDALDLVEGMKKNHWGGMGELKKKWTYLFIHDRSEFSHQCYESQLAKLLSDAFCYEPKLVKSFSDTFRPLPITSVIFPFVFFIVP